MMDARNLSFAEIKKHRREIMKTETANILCPICGGKMDVKHVSSEAGRRLLKCPICGGEFIEVLSHWERNGKVVYENPEIQLTPIRKVLERNQRCKDALVSKKKQSIT